MNEIKTNPPTEATPSQPKPAAATPKTAPHMGAAVAMPEKIEVETALLSRSLTRDLQYLSREEWFRIESVAWRVGFTRDMVEGIRFVDAVANVVNQAGGLFASQNLNRRRELEASSQEIVEAFRTIILKSVEVARKLNLTNILERHWRLLSVYGPTPKNADRQKAAAKPEPAKQQAAVAEVA